jgi:hypothetical protein
MQAGGSHQERSLSRGIALVGTITQPSRFRRFSALSGAKSVVAPGSRHQPCRANHCQTWASPRRSWRRRGFGTAATGAGEGIRTLSPNPQRRVDHRGQIATAMYWHRRLRVPASTDSCTAPMAPSLGAFACPGAENDSSDDFASALALMGGNGPGSFAPGPSAQ